MREYKFRLIKDNKIVGYELFLDGKWIYSYIGENFNLYTPFINHDEKNQYTGLKDKNGKEIYEGDIVEIDWKDTRYEKAINKVEWLEKQACFTFGAGATSEVHWSHKVIGNIYENKIEDFICQKG